jgi:hypothetical protein
MITILLIGCAPSVDESSVVESADPNIGGLVHVSWETALPAAGWVEYGPDEDYTHISPLQDAAYTQDVALLGIPAGETWHYRIVTQSGGVTEATADRTIAVPPLPQGVPTATFSGEGELGGYTLFSWWSVSDGDSFVSIVDGDGAVIWFMEPDVAPFAQGARLSRDGTSVLYLESDIGIDESAMIVRAPLDGSPVERTPAPRAHHDFYERADGSIGYLAREIRHINERQVMADQIMVIRDGESSMVWDAFERLPMRENAGFNQEPADWTHANGLGWDEENGRWLVSLYHDHTILAVDDATGEMPWMLGGENSLFSFTGGESFGPQHAPEWTGDGVLLFDNSSSTASSRLVEFRLDMDRRQAEAVWSWKAPAGTNTHLYGDVDRIPGGGTVSAWGENEEVIWLDDAGEVTGRLSLGESQGILDNVTWLPSLWPEGAVFPDRSDLY